MSEPRWTVASGIVLLCDGEPAHVKDIARLLNERERYKAALEKIVANWTHRHPEAQHHCSQIAQAALTEQDHAK